MASKLQTLLADNAMNPLTIALQFSWLMSIVVAHRNITSSRCRCLYGQKCWPSTSDFSLLESQVSQPLIYPLPPASACYPASSPSGNCTDVKINQFNANWRADQSGASQSPNFETFTFDNGSISACYLNTTLGVPCQQGSVPIIGVDARTVSDVQEAVKFAAQHNLRLAVKNTGHDRLSRSVARGAFMIWTHHLKNVSYNASFIPEGAPSTETYDAVTLGAGAQFWEAYDVAQAQGRVLVGGNAPGGSVGAAGGWLLGGGHSPISPFYGLGVDNVIELKVVDSSGSYLTVNSHNHPDLFWALRGGGGGTYGIVTSVTYRTYPIVPLTGAFLTANSKSNNTLRMLLSEFVRIQPSLSDANFSGQAVLSPNSFQMFYLAHNVTETEANKTIDPFFAFAKNLTSEGLNVSLALTAPYSSIYEWYTPRYPTALGGNNSELASRLISRNTIEHNSQGIADAIMSIDGGAIWYHVAGGAVSKVDPDSTGLNPFWRRALAHVIWSIGWEEGTHANEIKRLRTGLAHTLQNMTSLTGSSAYFNEAFMFEHDPKFTFFGDHYHKLKAIKKIYDPIDLFIVREGVGSDDWDTSLNCRI